MVLVLPLASPVTVIMLYKPPDLSSLIHKMGITELSFPTVMRAEFSPSPESPHSMCGYYNNVCLLNLVAPASSEKVYLARARLWLGIADAILSPAFN